jgi:opacity protein-like surface antigen
MEQSMKYAKQALGVFASLLVMSAASAARADNFPPASERPAAGVGTMPFRLGSGAMRHDQGIFVRPQIGFGNLAAEIKGDGGTQTVDGLASSFGLSVGGVVSEGLVLHGTLAISSIPGAEVDGGTPITTEQNRNFGVTSLGFGMTYYTPDNLWFSAGLAPHVMTLSTSSSNCDTTDCPQDTTTEDFGLGLRAGVGYEWWVSDDWAIGLGVEGFGAGGSDISTYGMTTMFTATFN